MTVLLLISEALASQSCQHMCSFCDALILIYFSQRYGGTLTSPYSQFKLKVQNALTNWVFSYIFLPALWSMSYLIVSTAVLYLPWRFFFFMYVPHSSSNNPLRLDQGTELNSLKTSLSCVRLNFTLWCSQYIYPMQTPITSSAIYGPYILIHVIYIAWKLIIKWPTKIQN